jgi:hypothetical protein
MLTEADYKRRLVAEVNALRNGWAERWEDRWRPGIPDLVIKLPGLPIVFAEGKLIKGYLFSPSELQFLKGQRIQNSGLRVQLLGWTKDGEMYVSQWVRKADRRECFTMKAEDSIVLFEYLKSGRP